METKIVITNLDEYKKLLTDTKKLSKQLSNNIEKINNFEFKVR